jgi:hypothetical protein
MTGTRRSATTVDAAEVLEPMGGEQARTYERLRSHLAELRLGAAAESLTTVLDAARDEDLSAISVLERLLGIEVAAAHTRRHAGLLRFASLPAPYAIEQPFGDLTPERALDLPPMQRRPRRLHRRTSSQCLHPPRWPAHQHLHDQGVATTS